MRSAQDTDFSRLGMDREGPSNQSSERVAWAAQVKRRPQRKCPRDRRAAQVLGGNASHQRCGAVCYHLEDRHTSSPVRNRDTQNASCDAIEGHFQMLMARFREKSHATRLPIIFPVRWLPSWRSSEGVQGTRLNPSPSSIMAKRPDARFTRWR